MVDRIKLIMTAKNLAPSAFADVIGVQRSAISHLLSGRNNPSLDFIQKILRKFPEISSEWLLTGKGEMNKKVLSLFDFDEESKEKSSPVALSEEMDEPEPFISEAPVVKEEEKEVLPVMPVVKKEAEKTEPVFSGSRDEGIIKALMSGKKIKKIVFFYEDRTFAEFFPED